MKWMFNIVILALVIQVAVPQYLQIEIGRISAFVEHFLHLNYHANHIHLNDFMHKHYSRSEYHIKDHNEHKKLPFHNHSEKCTIGQIQIALVNPTKFEIEAICTNKEPGNISYVSPCLTLHFSNSIWRPPKLS